MTNQLIENNYSDVRALTATVVFEGSALNRDDRLGGNELTLKTLTRNDGIYSYFSRRAIRYHVFNTLQYTAGWKEAPLDATSGKKTEEGNDKNYIIQFRFPEANIVDYEEIDIFGYMNTIISNNPTRKAVLGITKAISLEPFRFDSEFGANHDLVRRIRQDNELFERKHLDFDQLNPNPFSSAEHYSYFKVSFCLDLHNLGYDEFIIEECKNLNKEEYIEEYINSCKQIQPCLQKALDKISSLNKTDLNKTNRKKLADYKKQIRKAINMLKKPLENVSLLAKTLKDIKKPNKEMQGIIKKVAITVEVKDMEKIINEHFEIIEKFAEIEKEGFKDFYLWFNAVKKEKESALFETVKENAKWVGDILDERSGWNWKIINKDKGYLGYTESNGLTRLIFVISDKERKKRIKDLLFAITNGLILHTSGENPGINPSFIVVGALKAPVPVFNSSISMNRQQKISAEKLSKSFSNGYLIKAWYMDEPGLLDSSIDHDKGDKVYLCSDKESLYEELNAFIGLLSR